MVGMVTWVLRRGELGGGVNGIGGKGVRQHYRRPRKCDSTLYCEGRPEGCGRDPVQVQAD